MENVKYTLLLLLAGGVAHAATEIKTVGDIDRLQSGRVLYEAQAAFNKAKNEAGQGDGFSLPVGPAQGATAAQPGTPASTAANTMPSLEKVVGQEATLRLADGTMTSVRAGIRWAVSQWYRCRCGVLWFAEKLITSSLH